MDATKPLQRFHLSKATVKIFEKTFQFLALYPLIWLLLMVLFVLRARWSLGYFPKMYRPDPGQLGFDFHGVLLWILLVSLKSAALVFPLAFFAAQKSDFRLRIKYCFIFFLSWISIKILVDYPPTKEFLLWFLD